MTGHCAHSARGAFNDPHIPIYELVRSLVECLVSMRILYTVQSLSMSITSVLINQVRNRVLRSWNHLWVLGSEHLDDGQFGFSG